jgi:hypothetical protein
LEKIMGGRAAGGLPGFSPRKKYSLGIFLPPPDRLETQLFKGYLPFPKGRLGSF